MSVECRITRARLARSAGEEHTLGRLAPHLQACLRCQAEAARYRKLARQLASLADASEPAPVAVAEAVTRRIAQPVDLEDVAVSRTAPVARAAAVVGALAAAAGTAVVVRILRTRSAA